MKQYDLRCATALNPAQLIAVAAAIILAFACTGRNGKEGEATEEQVPPQVEQLRKEVIAIHDDVMPLMTDIYKLKSALNTKIVEIPAAEMDKKKSMETLIADLDKANRGMREWMIQFSTVKIEDVPEDEAMEALKEQKRKIETVKNDMIQSVEAARRELSE